MSRLEIAAVACFVLGAGLLFPFEHTLTITAGVLLLGESLTANKVLGGAVILLGVYLARKQ